MTKEEAWLKDAEETLFSVWAGRAQPLLVLAQAVTRSRPDRWADRHSPCPDSRGKPTADPLAPALPPLGSPLVPVLGGGRAYV